MRKADWERMDDALHEIAAIVADTRARPTQRLDRIAILLRRLGYLLGETEHDGAATRVAER